MDQRRGYLFGLLAYAVWGFFPLYFHLLLPAGPLEILSHRVIWSLVFVALAITALRRWSAIRELIRHRDKVLGLCVAAVLVGVNWFVYVYGVNSGHVVETSLGYFINPLISVLFGVFVFRERLRPAQWTAIGIGALAVAVLTVKYGKLPWIALSLAVSFASYGLAKKRIGAAPTDGLLLESSVLALPALVYLATLTAQGRSTFGSDGVGHTALLILAGLVTAVPLMLFAAAANAIPMTGLGMLQYTAPILQLAVGVWVFHEPMPPARLVGFGLVWLALVVFTWDAVRNVRRTRQAGRAEEIEVAAAAALG
jgi:chloramphenicol-sensitive protein RarD